MKKQLLAATALLAWTAVPVLAQDTSVDLSTDISAGVSAETPALDAGASANANANANANASSNGNSDNTYGSVISSISSSASVDLSGVTDEASVTIVLLSSLQGNADTESSALDTALDNNADATTTLHANVTANAVVKGKVEAAGYTVDDVVAVKTSADGSLIVYVDDRE